MNKPSLELRQGQTLIMTEQLRQSIQLLQYSAQELSEYIEQEMESNPLLATEDPSSDNTTSEEKDEPDNVADHRSSDEPDRTTEPDMYTNSLDVNAPDEKEGQQAIDASNSDIWGGELESPRYEQRSNDMASGNNSFLSDTIEQSYARQPDLREHVRQQVAVDITDPEASAIAHYLTDLLDESGYLREKPGTIARQLGCPRPQVEHILEKLKQMDPPGVFSGNLSECLGLQLKEKGLLDRPMERLLSNLELMATGDLKRLCRLCRVSRTRLARMLQHYRCDFSTLGHSRCPDCTDPMAQGVEWR